MNLDGKPNNPSGSFFFNCIHWKRDDYNEFSIMIISMNFDAVHRAENIALCGRLF